MYKETLWYFDGAFGTYFASRYPSADYEPEKAVFRNPDAVLSIHRAYLKSGADAIKTDTYGSGALYAMESERNEQIKAAWELAQKAAESKAMVFADMGPVDGTDPDAVYLSEVRFFISLGARHFLFETLHDIRHHASAIVFIRENVPDAVIVTSFAVSQDGCTSTGESYRHLFREAVALGADYVGLNCSCGPSHMRDLIAQIDCTRYRIVAMPNAGYPTSLGGRTVYMDNPDYFAQRAYEIAQLGVSVLGGCCGTTATHIKAMVDRTKDLPKPTYASDIHIEEKPQQSIKQGIGSKMIIAVEIGTLADPDPSYLVSAAKTCREAGADFVTIPDSPLAKAKANSFMTAAYVKRAAGIPVIPHLCCRDKNQIALKGDLVGGAMEGIDHVLAITGDPLQKTDRDSVKNVFSMNSFHLIQYITSLNETIFADEPYHVFGALNIGAANFDSELARAEKKIQCGVEALFTQPIYSEESVRNFLLAVETLSCRVVAGIMPPAGYRNALFLNNEVPGVTIPDSVLEALRTCKPEENDSICLSYAKGLIDAVFGKGSGFYLMTPLKKIHLTEALVRYLREKEKSIGVANG